MHCPSSINLFGPLWLLDKENRSQHILEQTLSAISTHHAPPKPDQSPKPSPGHDTLPDLDELWRRFNHRVASLFRFRKDGLKKGDAPPPPNNGRIRLRIVMGAICSLIIAAWLGSGLYIVGSNQTGVVLQFGAYQYTTLPGMRWHWPFPFQSHECVDTATHTVEISSDQTGRTAHSADALMLTQDGGLVDARFALHYRITDPQTFLFNHASVHTSVIQAGEAALREIFSTLTLEDTLTSDRIDLSSRLTRKVQEILDLRRTGILVTGVAERKAQLPKSVKIAFEEALHAAQERERQKKEATADAQRIQMQARAEARQRVDEAELYKARMISTAHGENERFKQVLAGYLQAPEITRTHMYLDTMREMYAHSIKVFSNRKVAQQMIVLPLEKLITQDDQSSQKTRNAEKAASSSTESTQTKEMSPAGGAARWSHKTFHKRGQSRTGIEE